MPGRLDYFCACLCGLDPECYTGVKRDSVPFILP
jgi:hypothetical protein